MFGAIDIDTTALWHTIVIAFAAGLVAILAAGSVIFSLDRATISRTRAQWYTSALVGGVIVAGILILGFWAMTQK